MGDENKTTVNEIPRTPDQLRAFLKQTQSGDQTTLPVLLRMLQDPANVRVFGGELAELAELLIVSEISARDIGMREAVMRKIELLRAELLGPDPTPVERLLVERVVACWVQVQEADLRYATAIHKPQPVRLMESYQRRMDAANRRYLTSLKTLATVRKLALPVLQVNIARKQVNIAGAGPAEGSAE